MKYLCLAFYDEDKLAALTPAQIDSLGKDCGPYDAALRGSGHLVSQASLGPREAAATIRPRQGRPSVTDGPWTESKEQVGGFFILEARDLNEAILVASRHPAAHLNEHLGGGIEVRPLEMYEQP
jgi:hypothetical protein